MFTEAELRAALTRFPNVELRLGACLLDLIQGETGAILTLADGSTAKARYVIACDGARSAVRKALGIYLEDRVKAVGWRWRRMGFAGSGVEVFAGACRVPEVPHNVTP